MKKIIILFISVFLSVMNLMSVAEIVSTEVAKEVADNFLLLDNDWHHKTDATIQLIIQPVVGLLCRHNRRRRLSLVTILPVSLLLPSLCANYWILMPK